MALINYLSERLDKALETGGNMLYSLFTGRKPEEKPPDDMRPDEMNFAPGGIVINGIALPERVAEELRRLGISLSWYTSGELESAVEACAYDGQLIDDPNGDNFHDKLKLTPDELPEQPSSFREMILKERAARHILSHSEEEQETACTLNL